MTKTYLITGASEGIVNLSAAAATRPTPYFAAYAASKAFVNDLSIAIDSELRGHGLSVSAIHPPAVRTGFGAADKADLKTTLVHKLFPTMGPATVARAVRGAARLRHPSLALAAGGQGEPQLPAAPGGQLADRGPQPPAHNDFAALDSKKS